LVGETCCPPTAGKSITPTAQRVFKGYVVSMKPKELNSSGRRKEVLDLGMVKTEV